MKTFFVVLFLIVFFTSSAFAVELLEEKPTRKYSIVNLYSIKKNKMDKIISEIKKKAEKDGADAVIFNCTAGKALNAGFLKVRLLGTRDACSATAIKWK